MNIVQQEELNFLLTNRIPRRTLTRFMGWFSRIEQPLVRDVSMFVWKLFADLDLSDAQQTRFRSLHDCFTRTLKDGARPVDMDPSIVVSPCDAIVGASGRVTDGQVLQVKGLPYALEDLLGLCADEVLRLFSQRVEGHTGPQPTHLRLDDRRRRVLRVLLRPRWLRPR